MLTEYVLTNLKTAQKLSVIGPKVHTDIFPWLLPEDIIVVKLQDSKLEKIIDDFYQVGPPLKLFKELQAQAEVINFQHEAIKKLREQLGDAEDEKQRAFIDGIAQGKYRQMNGIDW